MSDIGTSVLPTEPTSMNFLAGGGEMGVLIRAHDWSNTPLGQPTAWPQSLRTAVRIMLTSRQPIWIGWGPELTYLYNDAYQSIIGGKHPWALGRPTMEVWSEIWPAIGPMLATAMEGVEGTYVEEQLLIMERNGYPEETYYTFSYSPIPDDSGAPGGIICANTDDTQRVIGERQLGLLRELAAETVDVRSWREVCDRSTQALAKGTHDLPFALLYMSEPQSTELALVATTGITSGFEPPVDALAGWPIGDVMRDHKPRLIATLPDGFAARLAPGIWEKQPRQAALLAIPAKGDAGRSGVLVVGLNPYRLFGDGYSGFLSLVAGQIAAAVASADAYEQERRRGEVLAELDRAKTAFFSNVSHEFRTPLTLMLGPLEEALVGAMPMDEIRARISVAHRNGTRLLRLVNSLLDFSRLEAGRVQATFAATDLAEFSTDISSSFRTAIERAGLTFNLDMTALPHPVYVDRDMWEKILLNLLSNALKFTFEGSITVALSPSRDGQTAMLQVKDSGIGIAAADLPRLFERFHRIEGAQRRSFEGSGIGLALVQELVRLHGGGISTESTPGVGTVFTVTIPFGTAHLPADRVIEHHSVPESAGSLRAHEYVDEALRWLPGKKDDDGQPLGQISIAGLNAVPVPGTIGPGLGKRVLLADDNADMRDFVRRLLTSSGYAVDVVPDGEAALASLHHTVPDLLLTDIMMPKLDGFGLLRAIRSDPAIASLPVIVLSARAGEEAKVEGLEAGADDYLIKPFAARELLARVNANIQMAESRRAANRAIFQSEQKALMSEDRLSIALSTGRVAVFEWEVESDRVAVLGPLGEVFGVDPARAATEGLPLETFIAGIHPDDRDRVVAAINRSVDTSQPFEADYRVIGGGSEGHIAARGRVTSIAGGRRLAGALMDITERMATQQALEHNRNALEDQTRALQILNRAAETISGDLDLEHLVQTVIDAGVDITGADYGAFFYSNVDAAGEYLTLYALSGAPREAFASFPTPRNTAIFEPTFSGAGVVRFDDVTRTAEYGRTPPFNGMPSGHLPVRSYLAVPVRSRSGDVLGALLFGHHKAGVFGQIVEDRVVGLAAQAAVAMDNAQLFQAAERELQHRHIVESELQVLNATLEDRVTTEIAERVKAEDALRQAQKMEAIGQLTGGVAHDFNNLLTVIIGGLETIRRSNPSDEGRRVRAVDMALKGAQRAANLTSRLLAFSRRQPLEPKPIELNIVVRDMTDLLHRTLGEDIELEGVLTPRLWTVEADQNQLESAILNLAVNARDAMPDGGKLTIETSNTMLDESYAAVDTEIVPGQYVAIAVSDSGSGISKETLSRVFEPFFTTKEVGRGTGLGLSMVYGFVKQSGGHVTIYSEQDHGTTVKLYFPRFRGAASENDVVQTLAIPRSSVGEVVLLVEDNDDVRSYSAMILSELGYRVLEAADADAGLAIINMDQRIDLLFTDVVLPGKSGKVLADAAAKIRPDLKVLFTTGYSRNAIVHHGRLDAGVELISKPFTFEQLAARIRDVLDKM